MTYYINEVELADAYISQRSSKDSWNAKSKGTARIPFVERGSQDPTNFDMEIKFLTAERYNVATSITAEIEQCEEILLRNDNSKKLYGTEEWIWLKQSEFSIVEEEGYRLIGNLSGQIDPYMIHSCDFTTNWTAHHESGGSAGTVSTTTPHDGKQCIKHSKSSPTALGTYWCKYTFPDAVDLSDFTKIRCWVKCNKASSYFSAVHLKLSSDATSYLWGNIGPSAADTWEYKTLNIQNPPNDTGSPDLTAITEVEFRMGMSSGTDDWDFYIDNITLQ